jgi:acyl-CoA hydrolase
VSVENKEYCTKLISEINFMSPGYQGDVIEIGVDVVSIGRTSITLAVDVRNKDTEKYSNG